MFRYSSLLGIAFLISACSTTHSPASTESNQFPIIGYINLQPLPLDNSSALFLKAATLLNEHDLKLQAIDIQNQAAPFPALIAKTDIPSHEEFFPTDTDKGTKTQNFAQNTDEIIPVLASLQGVANNGGWKKVGANFVHSYSGMVCTPFHDISFTKKSSDKPQKLILSLQKIHVFDGEGYDTACHYSATNGGVPLLTFYASYWPDVALEDHFASAANDMRRMNIKSGASIIQPTVEMDKNEQTTIEGETRSVAYLIEAGANKVELKTALWLNKTSGWHIKARATYHPADILTELLASVLHLARLMEVDKHMNSKPSLTNDLTI